MSFYEFCFQQGLYIQICTCQHFQLSLTKNGGSFEGTVYSFNFKRKPGCEINFTIVCMESIPQQKTDKNGPATKFTFEVIS